MEFEMEIDGFKSKDSEASATKKLKHNEDAVVKSFGDAVVVEGSASGSLKLENVNNSSSDLSFNNDDDGNDLIDEGDDVSDYIDEDEYMYHDDSDKDDEYLKMQAQFDSVDLPTGVEASVSWLGDSSFPAKTLPSSSTSVPNDSLDKVPVTGPSFWNKYDPVNVENEAASSSSVAFVESSSAKKEAESEMEILRKFQLFKRFDIVADVSDHHFSQMGFSEQQPPKSWTKRVQGEWEILEKDLPDAIYVRVYEARMDLLRAVIVGPAGTPYHDGLFVFDVHFPTTYPDIPPMVYYYSGGLRLNPNLYDCGKVCLSLLNTWSGSKNEMWMPKKSTMLQVLVSIQALILNANPFFNEPGYDNMYPGLEGQKRSKSYNEDVFILSLKTMIYTLRRPPKHFEELVYGHFRLRAHDILSACKAYLEGAEIGSVVNGSTPDGNRSKKNHCGEFREAVSRLMNTLVTYFTKNGSDNCEQFRVPG